MLSFQRLAWCLNKGILLLGFPGGSDDKEFTCSSGDPDSIPGSRRSPGEENGNSLQYSCLENTIDRGAWWATVYGVMTELLTHTFVTIGLSTITWYSSMVNKKLNFLYAFLSKLKLFLQLARSCDCSLWAARKSFWDLPTPASCPGKN